MNDGAKDRKIFQLVEQPMLKSPSWGDDFTPRSPITATVTNENTAHKGSLEVKSVESPEFDITSYTNGSMVEIMNDTNYLTKEKAEFMYLFEGAMTVINETEEPEDDLTAKSSSLQLREDSIVTPN